MSELTRRERRHTSLFGPVVLIAVGLFFLFNYLDVVNELYWLDALRLWPLLLVFGGLNLLVLQAPRPYASLLSGLLAVVAVLLFGAVLLLGLGGTPFRVLGAGAWQTEPIQFAASDVEAATYEITIGPPGADLYALEDERTLIAGSISYRDDYLFETDVTRGEATIRLAPQNPGQEWRFLRNYWGNYDEAARWQVGINPNVPAAMILEAVAGDSQLDLSDLQVASLRLTANAGDVALLLPGGTYLANLTTNAATTEITLPATGRQTMHLEVNAGLVTLHLPPNMALHVEVDRALGSFSANNAGLRPVAGQGNMWETAGYAQADNRVDLSLHISVGSVTIE